MESYFFDRDISWLSFNERVLEEAGKESVPVGERLNFLSIYSSNLDEFYRVRIPSLMGLEKVNKKKGISAVLTKINSIVNTQQQRYGQLINELLSPLKKNYKIDFLYGKPLPEELENSLRTYFFTEVAAFIQPVFLKDKPDFFPINNKLYLAVSLTRKGQHEMAVVNIPSGFLTRFLAVKLEAMQYLIFMDDIVRSRLKDIFPDAIIHGAHSFKITRDAELDLKDDYEGDLADKIAEQLHKRDMGYATRFLYDASMPEGALRKLVKHFKLRRANQMSGGRYHNLKDLNQLPLPHPDLFYKKWPPLKIKVKNSIFDKIEATDFLINTPYEDYRTVLRFFSEAALDKNVEEIYLTVYRLASASRIARALISAAKNGKKVTVFVELKARFDEANNIHWSRKLQAAGAHIIYSIPGWKVHAKVALVKRKRQGRSRYYGILGTGNFNETTAQIYADNILFTGHKQLLAELELLFLFLEKRRRIEGNPYRLEFKNLLVARFNLFDRLNRLVDDEINQAKQGKTAKIILKINNLDEERLIEKLYQASQAGVEIKLLVRSICRLVPGVKGMSENISIHRIVDRYLEHGRIFIFHHGGEELMFSGSADWMRRNIRRRIEVIFPVYQPKIRRQLKQIVRLGLADNTQAVAIDKDLNNIPVSKGNVPVQAQKEIYQFLLKNAQR